MIGQIVVGGGLRLAYRANGCVDDGRRRGAGSVWIEGGLGMLLYISLPAGLVHQGVKFLIHVLVPTGFYCA